MNRIKATLARLGIRNFKPGLRKSLDHIGAVRTPEGTPLPDHLPAALMPSVGKIFLIKASPDSEAWNHNSLALESLLSTDPSVDAERGPT
jgi:hypothetical protein